MLLGEKIRLRRKELNISIEALAKATGKNRATIYRYEDGDIENMPTTVLETLSKALLTTPAYLMGWDEKPQTTTLNNIDILNDIGIQRVQSYIDDLILIDKYKKGNS